MAVALGTLPAPLAVGVRPRPGRSIGSRMPAQQWPRLSRVTRTRVGVSVASLNLLFYLLGSFSDSDPRLALQLLNPTQRQLLKRCVFDWMVYL